MASLLGGWSPEMVSTTAPVVTAPVTGDGGDTVTSLRVAVTVMMAAAGADAGDGDAGLARVPSPAGAITKLGRQRARLCARAVTKADALSLRMQTRQRFRLRRKLNKTMGTAARVGR